MKGSGPRIERETIINFNEVDDTATIWTASDTVYRRLLKRLGRAYLTEDGERHAVFTFPVKFMDLPRVKARKELTPEHRGLCGRLVWPDSISYRGRGAKTALLGGRLDRRCLR